MRRENVVNNKMLLRGYGLICQHVTPLLFVTFATSCSNELGLQTRNARHESSRPNSRYQQVVILPGMHVVSRDFSDRFLCSGIRVIHKISVIYCNVLCVWFQVLGRLLLGFAVALSATAECIYISEISPPVSKDTKFYASLENSRSHLQAM